MKSRIATSLDARIAHDDDFKLKRHRMGRGNDTRGAAPKALGKRLASRFKHAARVRSDSQNASFVESYSSDPRQRAVVKVHYFGHTGGGGAALRAHGNYIERDSAQREADVETDPHATYLSREGREGFYGPEHDKVDGKSQLADWAQEDPRHFRIILAPENGQAIGDLREYTREVMDRAEASLGRPLQWVAVNHWDTDNPHAHIVLRGRDGDGRVLGLPREFVKHTFRDIARDAATERLGPRTPEQARDAMEREVRAHRFTRLDGLIEQRLDAHGRVRMADLGKGEPAYAKAIQSRAVELTRLGLVEESRRGELSFAPDWKERLQGLEAHIDIRRQVIQERAHDKAFAREARALERETGKLFGDVGRVEKDWKVRGEVDLPGGKYLALERHDRVALAPKPPGMGAARGQSVSASIKAAGIQITKGLGLER
jgi:type IV secretory pathway VirD2 relaxase